MIATSLRRLRFDGATPIAAMLFAAVVFAIDSAADIEVAVAILYLVVPTFVSLNGGERQTYVASGVCIALAVISWAIVHGSSPDLASSLRLLFACIAMGITCALLVSRKKLQATRADLERSREELELFANSVPHILWRANDKGEVQYFNTQFSEITGLDRKEAVEKQNYMSIVHPDDLAQLQETVADALANQSVSRANARIRHADGEYRWMQFYDRPVPSRTSGIVERFGGATDIEALIRAQQEVRELNDTLEQRVRERSAELLRTEARYGSLYDVSSLPFAEEDLIGIKPLLDDLRRQGLSDISGYLDGHPDVLERCIGAIKTLRVNGAFVHMLGYESAEHLVGTPPEQLLEDARAIRRRQIELAFHGRRVIEGRATLISKAGRRIPVHFTINRLDDERQLCSLFDLSRQEQIEELRLAAQDELARANRVATVGAFSSSVAHELNQPIASLVMDAQAGLRWLQRDTPDIGAAIRAFTRVTRNADRMAGIVRNTRDKIAGGRRSIASVDLGALAMETRELLARDLRRNGAVIELRRSESTPPVLGDRVELQQVLVNLLTNAIEAMLCMEEGTRSIELSVTDADGRVQVDVADRGPGIPGDKLHRLFEPFFTTKSGGVGVGLQICKAIIENCGGTLTARNRDTGGAIFQFILPAAPAIESDSPVNPDNSGPECPAEPVEEPMLAPVTALTEGSSKVPSTALTQSEDSRGG